MLLNITFYEIEKEHIKDTFSKQKEFETKDKDEGHYYIYPNLYQVLALLLVINQFILLLLLVLLIRLLYQLQVLAQHTHQLNSLFYSHHRPMKLIWSVYQNSSIV